jgi:hypothetical protein
MIILRGLGSNCLITRGYGAVRTVPEVVLREVLRLASRITRTLNLRSFLR